MNKREKRLKLLADARAMLNKAETEGRDLTPEESAQYDALLDQADTLLREIEREERLVRMESQEQQPTRNAARPTPVPADAAQIGMTTRDVQRYSLVRAIRAAMSNDWRGAELEREASAATAQRLGREPNGSFFVPADWLESRDLTVGTNSAGGYTVSTDLLAQNFIDLLRNRMALRQAGATMLTGLVGNIAIPRQTGGATAYWVAENSAPTESAQAFDQVTMTPHTVGAFTDISRRLLNQSSIDVEMLVRTDLATVLALAIDLAGLHGTGSSNQPTGLAATSGIGSVAGGTNGAAPTLANIDGDADLEIVLNTASAGFVAYDLPGTANARILWGTGRGSYRRSGAVVQPSQTPMPTPSTTAVPTTPTIVPTAPTVTPKARAFLPLITQKK